MTALALCLVMAVACPPARAATAKQVTGWVQNVAFYPGGLIVRAKMDSGAKTSSLHVAHMERFIRDSRTWVRFKVTNSKGNAAVFEQPVVRIARIKREDGRVEQVPVVMLDICLGTVRKRTQVGLNDRTGFNYQFLVG
ncbi:MAG TPA: ATP-dependent zinc protease, partial [Gammaproteobacteria bacterium]|nr:ATP-dependent zinc protease [Gammaproteobacteria bacterium]